MPSSMSHWCVVYTQPRGEMRARHYLRQQGYTTYAPVIRRQVRHARQTKTVQAPLFPRYIFVKLDLGRDRWLSINATAGVSKLITVRDKPVPLPAGLVEALMRAHEPEGEDEDLRVNDRVKLGCGAFADLIGRIGDVDDKGRVQVLLEILGRAVTVRTTVSQLRPPAQTAAASGYNADAICTE